MKLVDLEIETIEIDNEDGGATVLPAQFLLVLEDDAENQYKVETNYDTYKAVNALRDMLSDVQNYKVG